MDVADLCAVDPCAPFTEALSAPGSGITAPIRGRFLWVPADCLDDMILRAADPAAEWLPRAPVRTTAGALWCLPRALFAGDALADLWRHSGRAPYEKILDWEGPGETLQALKIREGFQLRSEQKDALRAIQEGRSGTLALGCGGGKTILGLYRAATVRGATLVVATQHAHLLNWYAEAQEHFDLDPGGVGWVSGGRCETDKPLVFATVQALARVQWDASLSKRFGLVLFDEAHHMSAATYLPTASLVGGQRIALSATPVRVDYAQDRYLSSIGPVLYQARGASMSPIFRTRRVRLTAPAADAAPKASSAMDGWVTSHPEVLAAARTLVEGLRAEGRIVYVLSKSKQVSLLHAILPEGTAGLITGDTPAEDRLHQLNDFPVVLVTAGVGQENYNRPDLDTLIYLTIPTTYTHAAPLLQQTTGRITRVVDGKRRPEVWLLHPEGLRVVSAHARKTLAWARQQGYEVLADRVVGTGSDKWRGSGLFG